MSDMWHVYILRSAADTSRHYSGITTDLDGRLKKHNKGDCTHTAKYRPWKIETCVSFCDKRKAVAFEKYLKSGSGREFARRHL